MFAESKYKGTKFILAGYTESQKYKLGGAYKVVNGEISQYKGCTFTLATEEDLKVYSSIKDLPEDLRTFVVNFDSRLKGKIVAINLKTGERIIIKDTKHMKELGFTNPNVYACCNGKLKEYKGYSFQRETLCYG